jgi:autonomous glycyl radical cofactor GrcA
MIAHEDAKNFVEFLEKYNNHFTELKKFITVKHSKALDDDVVWLENSLKEEERFVMAGNSFEKKRIALMSRLGFGDIKYEKVADEFPDCYKGRLRVCADEMRNSIKYIRNTNKNTLDIVQRKLNIQSEILAKPSVSGAEAYTKTGGKTKKTHTNTGGGFIGKA